MYLVIASVDPETVCEFRYAYTGPNTLCDTELPRLEQNFQNAGKTFIESTLCWVLFIGSLVFVLEGR